MTDQKKKKKKPINIIVFILGILTGFCIDFKYHLLLDDITNTYSRIFIYVLSFLIIFFLVLMSHRKPKNKKSKTIKLLKGVLIFLKNLWLTFLIPFTIISIILLGAIQKLYPIVNPPLEDKEVITRVIVLGIWTAINKIYTIGQSHPKITIWAIIIWCILCIIAVILKSLDNIEENKDAQELIDTVNKENDKI